MRMRSLTAAVAVVALVGLTGCAGDAEADPAPTEEVAPVEAPSGMADDEGSERMAALFAECDRLAGGLTSEGLVVDGDQIAFVSPLPAAAEDLPAMLIPVNCVKVAVGVPDELSERFTGDLFEASVSMMLGESAVHGDAVAFASGNRQFQAAWEFDTGAGSFGFVLVDSGPVS